MKLVYIVSPFASDVENNVKVAKAFSLFAVNSGFCPIASHLLYPQFLDDTVAKERLAGTECGLELLRRCDEVWVLSGRISEGMKREILLSKELKKLIRVFCFDGIAFMSCEDECLWK